MVLRFEFFWLDEIPIFHLRVSNPNLDQNRASYDLFAVPRPAQNGAKKFKFWPKKSAKFELEKEGLGIGKSVKWKKCRKFPILSHRIGFGISKILVGRPGGPEWPFWAQKMAAKAKGPPGGQKGDPPRGRLVKKMA